MNQIVDKLKKRGVGTRPLASSPSTCFKKFDFKIDESICPNSKYLREVLFAFWTRIRNWGD